VRFAQLRESLRSSLWFVPAVCVVLAAAAAQVLVHLQPGSTTWLFGGGPESARTLLSTLAASMITFLGLTFSITMVVLQLTSSQYSPRVLRTFLRDRQSQSTLGIFVATFVYVVLVLREVRGEASDVERFVPGAAITFSFVLLLASLAMFVAYINHMAQSIRPESIITQVAAETRSLVEQRPMLGANDGEEHAEDHLRCLEASHPRSVTVCSTGEGVLQSIDVDRLATVAGDARVAVVVRARIGEHVREGAPLLGVHPTGEASSSLEDGVADRLRSCLGLGRDRTMQQDVAFGLRQLVDVGIRALSPSINDPTTAVQVIDRLHTILAQLGTREWPPSVRTDSSGDVRVVLLEPGWDDMVHLAVDELRHYGSGSVQVLRRLHAALDDLSACVAEDLRPPLQEQLTLLRAAAERSFPDAADRRLAALPDGQGLGAVAEPRRTKARADGHGGPG
jgi:uncharacterized membrane protein